MTGWEDVLRTNIILADIYDILQAIDIHLISMGGGKRKQFKPYPRPNQKETKRIGKGAMPYNKLREWIKEKQNG